MIKLDCDYVYFTDDIYKPVSKMINIKYGFLLAEIIIKTSASSFRVVHLLCNRCNQK